jgi:trk system potassium uptake protein TrkA
MAIAGHRLSQLRIPDGVLIAAMQRRRAVIIPGPDTTIEEGDRLVVMAQLSEVFDLEKLLKTKKGLLG